MNRLLIALSATLLVACATTDNRSSLAAEEAAQVNALYDSGQISLVQRERGFVHIAQAYYPADGLSINCQKERLYLAQDLEGKKINKAQFDHAYTASIRRCDMAITQRNSNMQAQVAEEDRLRRAVAISAGLSGIGKAAATSWGQSITPPSTICNAYGGTMYCYPPY